MKIISVTLIFLILIASIGIASAKPVFITTEGGGGTIVIEPKDIVTKYVQYDKFFGVHRLTAEISLYDPAKLVYVENYYGWSSDGTPKFYSSDRFYDGKVTGKVQIDIERPRDRYRSAYSLIEKVFIIDGVRSSTWIDLRDY